MEPILGGAATKAAEELIKEGLQHLHGKQPQLREVFCVEERIPGTADRIVYCRIAEPVCGTHPHPVTGAPVTECARMGINKAEVRREAKQHAQAMAPWYARLSLPKPRGR